MAIITAGIDVGSLFTKVLLLKDDDILSVDVLPTSEDVSKTVSEVSNKALSDANISINEVDSIASTGIGQNHVPFPAKQFSGVKCSIAGARYYFPLVQGVIDIGAESSKAMKCAANGKIVDFAANDKCAGGAGIFLDTMSLLLQIDADDPKSMDMITEQINITSTCVVFAESEVVTLIHKGMNRFDIWRGINESIAERAFSLAARIRASGKVALIGGIAKNPVFVSCFEKMSGYKLLIPTNAQFVNALGAAIYARESKK